MRAAPAAWVLLPLLALPFLAAASVPPAEAVVVQLHAPPTAEQRAFLLARGITAFVEVVPAGLGAVQERDLAWLRAQPWVLRVDPDEPLERHLDLSARLLRAGPPVEDLGVDGRGITVAVLDSGLDVSHPDLQGKVRANVVWQNGQWRDTQVDLDGHGTHVAGIIAGTGAASGGALRGVAPGAALVGMDFSRAFTTATALQAFDWVLRNREALGIRVVQNSWGRAQDGERWDPGDSLVRASNRLVAEGLVVVFSAGNRGPGPSTISLEGQNPQVVTVGAVDDAALRADFSGQGPVLDLQGQEVAWIKPDVVAPGVAVRAARSGQALGAIEQPTLVPSQLPGLGQPAGPEPARYTELSGTSQAAPHVAGIAALMLQANPALTPGQVLNLLREASIDLDAPGPDARTGFGLVDARDAVRRALGQPEDRGNVLLAGGEETYAAQGRITSANGQLVQTSPVLQVNPGEGIEAEVPVLVGATAVRFDLAWTPPEAGFRLFLVGPQRTLGPWTATRLVGPERVLSGFVEDPEPGVYRLLARPAGGNGAVDYRVAATVTIREQARLPAELAEQYRSPEQVGPLDQLASELEYEVAKVRRVVPGAEALLLPALAAVAVAIRGRSHAKSPPGSQDICR
jgi:subtilisin family serine protease